jgi:hypothetical protein
MTMRWKLFAVAGLIGSLWLPTTATAAVIDDFMIVGNGMDITFSLPATNLAYVTTPHSYWYMTFPEISNGVHQTGSLDFAVAYRGCNFFELSSLAGIPLCGIDAGPDFGYGGMWTLGAFTPAPGLYNAFVPLTFNAGTYQDTDLLHPIGPCLYFGDYACTYPQYTITITPEGTTMGATPEPGTLALLSTGLAGGVGLLRRRRTAS